MILSAWRHLHYYSLVYARVVAVLLLWKYVFAEDLVPPLLLLAGFEVLRLSWWCVTRYRALRKVGRLERPSWAWVELQGRRRRLAVDHAPEDAARLVGLLTGAWTVVVTVWQAVWYVARVVATVVRHCAVNTYRVVETRRRWETALGNKKVGLVTGRAKQIPFLSEPRTNVDLDVEAWVKPGRLGYVIGDIAAVSGRIAEVVGCRSMSVTPGDKPGVGLLKFRWTDALDRALPIAELPKAPPAARKGLPPLVYGIRQNGRPAFFDPNLPVLIAGETGSGKALALDTVVPTPEGWTTMGDIKTGDVVFSETGAPTVVTDTWDVRYGRPCYRVTFSDGTEIVADEDHQWTVETATSRLSNARDRNRAKPVGRRSEVMTTGQMVERTRSRSNNRKNLSIPVAGALELPDATLPLPPYTFGAWLGDGDSGGSGFTNADPEVLWEIESEGIQVDSACGPYHYRLSLPVPPRTMCLRCRALAVPDSALCAAHSVRRACPGCGKPTRGARCQTCGQGFVGTLRRMRVLNDKHVPTAYLRASAAQRLALLQGLLDTDGYCTPSGTAEFYNTNERLARDVHHLAASLGYQPRLRSKPATLHGQQHGTCWTVSFTTSDKVFRLPRKLARRTTTVRPSTLRRFVTSIEPVESVPVRCIAVAAESHQFLVGRTCVATHNSSLTWTLLAALNRAEVPVEIYAVDPKGGMELHELWKQIGVQNGLVKVARYTDDPGKEGAGRLFSEAATRLRKRQQHCRDNDIRAHVPTAEEPLIVVLVDELIDVVKTIKDTGEAGSPFGLLCKNGRAGGAIVVACTQAGHADVLGVIRNLIPQRACLGMRSVPAMATVLGTDAYERGARCNLLRPNVDAGLGWSMDESGRLEKFRVAYVDDQTVVDGANDVQRIARGVLPHGMGEAAEPLAEGEVERVAVYRVYQPQDRGTRLLYVGISNKPGIRFDQHRDRDRVKDCPLCPGGGQCDWWRVHVDPHRGDLRYCPEPVWYPDRATALRVERAAIEAEAPLMNTVHNQGNPYLRRAAARVTGKGRRLARRTAAAPDERWATVGPRTSRKRPEPQERLKGVTGRRGNPRVIPDEPGTVALGEVPARRWRPVRRPLTGNPLSPATARDPELAGMSIAERNALLDGVGHGAE